MWNSQTQSNGTKMDNSRFEETSKLGCVWGTASVFVLLETSAAALCLLCRYWPASNSSAPRYVGTESAGHYFELSLNAYKSSTGPHDPGFLAAQDDFCRHLLSTGQKKVKHTHTPTICTGRKYRTTSCAIIIWPNMIMRISLQFLLLRNVYCV